MTKILIDLRDVVEGVSDGTVTVWATPARTHDDTVVTEQRTTD